MVNARSHLQNALANLNNATADKGGYREQAIDLVRKAIDEVNAGIEYDRRHRSRKGKRGKGVQGKRGTGKG